MMSLIRNFKNLNLLRLVNRELDRLGLKPLLRQPILFIYRRILGNNLVTSKELIINPKKYQVQRFGLEEVMTVRETQTIGEMQSEEKKQLLSSGIAGENPASFTTYFEKPYVCEISNATLLGPNAVGFDEAGNIILDTTIPQFKELKRSYEKSVTIRALSFSLLPKNGINELNTACSLVGIWSRNYYHWIVDFLTRLEGLDYYSKQTGINPKLIIDPNPTKWHIDSLKFLGYEPENCIEWNGSRLQVKRLIVPCFRRNLIEDKFHGFVSPQACRWVSQSILSNLPNHESNESSFSSKVFISRRNSWVRRILNEDEVIAALTPLGFVPYTLETMSFSEEVRLFSQAKMVIAPHGAGLTNIIFSQNLKVIELFGSFVGPSIFHLSEGLGFQYGYLRCQSAPPDLTRKDGNINDSNIIVDIAKLLELVNRIEESSTKVNSADKSPVM